MPEARPDTGRPSASDPAAAWTAQYLERCFPEVAGYGAADVNLAMAMCRENPGAARIALARLALRVRAGCGDGAAAAFDRFALGILYLACAGVAEHEGRCGEGEVAPELEGLMAPYPEIAACASELGAPLSTETPRRRP